MGAPEMRGPDGRMWDTTVLFVARENHWWWNAWHPGREVEHSGSADSRNEAEAALARAVAPTPS